MPDKNVNKRLKIAILNRGITQRQVANEADMHETTLSHIINGSWNASQNEKVRIANALGVKVDSIF